METKSKILYLHKILNEKTDENNPISTTQIIKELAGIDINVTRKTVASDIAALCEFGIDVITLRSKQNMYYIGNRDFELPEVKLLVDAVESSKLITHKKSKVLISKLSSLVSSPQARTLKREIFIDNRIKPSNEEIYYNIDKVHDAITTQKQLQYKYTDFGQNKETIYKHNGLYYNLSPYALVWNNDHYYVVGFCSNHNKISKFRVDRMALISLTNVDTIPSPNDFILSDYINQMFNMYDGDIHKIELKCTNDLMKVIIDKFGQDVETHPLGSNCFKAIVNISVSPTFYAWLFQFSDKMIILSPEKIKNDFIDMTNKTLASY